MQAIVYLRGSDKDFLDRLFRTHYDMLNRLALGILKDEALAEDVVINAMLSLFSLVPKLRLMEKEELAAYLKRAVRNRAFKHMVNPGGRPG